MGMPTALAAAVLVMLAWGPASADKDLRYPPDRPREQPSRPKEDPGDPTVHVWRQGLEGRIFYLRAPRLPLLANDAVAIKRAKIRFFYPYDDGHTRRRYRVTLWFENVAPAPPETFRLDVEVTESLDELNAWLATEFSPLPLESDLGWTSGIQRMVRTRFIAAGMNAAMVELILGGLEYRVERVTLEDGRIREVWRLENSRRLRRAFAARRGMHEVPPPGEGGQATGTINQTAGFYLFGGEAPGALSIVFIDGQVVPPQP